MKLKQTTLATAITAALAMGVSGQASAYVYGASGLSIDNLQVIIAPSTGGSVVVNRFDFNLSNQATLNGNTVASTATCGGTPGAGNNCTSAIGSMDANAVNAPGSTSTRTNNQSSGGEFSFIGPATGFVGDYSSADSQIVTAELVNLGSLTQTHNVAESLLNNGTNASGTSQIQSITGFTISFTTTGGTSDFILNFDADPDLYAAIFGEPLGSYSAQANLNASITLQKSDNTAYVNWTPQGTTTNDCLALGVTSCAEIADTQDLNLNVGTTTNGTDAGSSWDPNSINLTHFGMRVTGMAAGNWTLTLNEVKSDQLARTPSVPEPGVLALLGIGLAGLGLMTRRRQA